MTRASAIAVLAVGAVLVAVTPGRAAAPPPAFEVLIGEVRVVSEASLDEPAVRTALDPVTHVVQACPLEPASPPRPEPVLLVYVAFDARGQASKVKVGGNVPPAFEKCVRKALAGARLATPPGAPAVVTARYVLRRVTPPAAGPAAAGPRSGGPGDGASAKPNPVPGRRVDLARASVDGVLEEDAVRPTLQQVRQRLEHCYDKELRRDPKTTGRFIWEIEIDGQGTVTQANAVHSQGPDTLAACTRDTLRRARFPAGQGEGSTIVKLVLLFLVEP